MDVTFQCYATNFSVKICLSLSSYSPIGRPRYRPEARTATPASGLPGSASGSRRRPLPQPRASACLEARARVGGLRLKLALAATAYASISRRRPPPPPPRARAGGRRLRIGLVPAASARAAGLTADDGTPRHIIERRIRRPRHLCPMLAPGRRWRGDIWT